MTIIEYALAQATDGSRIGLESGRAARAFVQALGERLRSGSLQVHAVPTSEETAALARQEGIPLLTLRQAGALFLGMADIVLIGDRNDFRLIDERRHATQRK